MLTFQYRLYPTQEQQNKLWLHANKLNWLYNHFLNQRIENHRTKTKTTRYTQQKDLVKLKKEEKLIAEKDSSYHDILNEIHSQVLQQVVLRLDNSYKDFFSRVKNKKGIGFPKYRSCSNFFGICYPQEGFTIKNNIFKTKVYRRN